MMPKVSKKNQPAFLMLIGLAVGFILFGLLRFVSYEDDTTHYHANFGVYVNAQRDQLANPEFYEDVAPCTADESSDPHHRAHLHDGVNDVVHVHANGVTWGQFFENLGYSISELHFKTADEVFVNNSERRVHYLLNGRTVSNPANLVIKSTDRLLVSFGPLDQDLNAQFDSIATTAQPYNQQDDPASCGGQSGGGFKARWQNIWN